MKYAIILYLALGAISSLLFSVAYTCTGHEMYPTFYGSPFVFKQASLASSLESYYSISGLLLNVVVWSLVLYFFDSWIQSRIKKANNPNFAMRFYKGLISMMVAFATLTIALDVAFMGQGFEKNGHYWYWDLDETMQDEEKWCEWKFRFLLN